mmetsp:Transcript_6474/g.22936  ORF Transcript_6474/g.22936 Transcript_6474/m.22936 type:complete len:477 (-) Transcript_6474:1591-3021(-)
MPLKSCCTAWTLVLTSSKRSSETLRGSGSGKAPPPTDWRSVPPIDLRMRVRRAEYSSSAFDEFCAAVRGAAGGDAVKGAEAASAFAAGAGSSPNSAPSSTAPSSSNALLRKSSIAVLKASFPSSSNRSVFSHVTDAGARRSSKAQTGAVAARRRSSNAAGAEPLWPLAEPLWPLTADALMEDTPLISASSFSDVRTFCSRASSCVCLRVASVCLECLRRAASNVKRCKAAVSANPCITPKASALSESGKDVVSGAESPRRRRKRRSRSVFNQSGSFPARSSNSAESAKRGIGARVFDWVLSGARREPYCMPRARRNFERSSSSCRLRVWSCTRCLSDIFAFSPCTRSVSCARRLASRRHFCSSRAFFLSSCCIMRCMWPLHRCASCTTARSRRASSSAEDLSLEHLATSDLARSASFRKFSRRRSSSRAFSRKTRVALSVKAADAPLTGLPSSVKSLWRSTSKAFTSFSSLAIACS